MNGRYIQHEPNSVQVELTEGCNLACSFCGLQGIRNNGANGPLGIRGKNSKPYKFMNYGTAHYIACAIKNAGWTSRLEFAMRGEPTLNKNYLEIIRFFREKLPKQSIMMTSNGGTLVTGNITNKIDSLLDAGLNVLLIDNYVGIGNAEKIIKAYSGKYPILYYPADKKANPHPRRKPTEHIIVIADDISIATKGTHNYLNNHCGCSFPLDLSYNGVRCARPFRELSIRWDGNVAVCCNDQRGVYKCGNILDNGLRYLWNNKYFYAARVKLYHGQRDFGPCYGCNARSMRVGLLPDRMGKETLPLPDKKIYKIISEAISGKPYTKPVKRPWEDRG